MRQADIAAHLFLSVRATREYFAVGLFTKGMTLDEIRQRYIERLRRSAAGRESKGDLDPQQEKAALDAARRAEIETRLAERRGELIPADAVADEWVRLVRNARARLLSIPSRVAGDVAGTTDMREVERMVKGAIFEALRELAGGADDPAD